MFVVLQNPKLMLQTYTSIQSIAVVSMWQSFIGTQVRDSLTKAWAFGDVGMDDPLVQ